MKPLPSILSIVFVTVLLADCKKDNDPQVAACQPPETMVAQAPCESGYPGALLISSDYKETSYTSFIFEIFPQKDTLSNDLLVRAWKNGANTHERILIGDTVLKDAPKFIVQVTLNCHTGKEYVSRYFAFVKRPTANIGCYIWARQAL